jgi:hypothetical protein
MLRLTGAQRLRQIFTKRRIADQREMRHFMEGRIAWCGGGDDKLFKAIEAEFERVAAWSFANGFAVGLASQPADQTRQGEP